MCTAKKECFLVFIFLLPPLSNDKLYNRQISVAFVNRSSSTLIRSCKFQFHRFWAHFYITTWFYWKDTYTRYKRPTFEKFLSLLWFSFRRNLCQLLLLSPMQFTVILWSNFPLLWRYKLLKSNIRKMIVKKKNKKMSNICYNVYCFFFSGA